MINGTLAKLLDDCSERFWNAAHSPGLSRLFCKIGLRAGRRLAAAETRRLFMRSRWRLAPCIRVCFIMTGNERHRSGFR